MHTGNRLACIEPDYKDFIDPKTDPANEPHHTNGCGRGNGMFAGSGSTKCPMQLLPALLMVAWKIPVSFLTKMVENNEELLTPTAFIQSTHNTIGAQIALMLQCNNYNNAFVHRGFSFESALLDAMLLIERK